MPKMTLAEIQQLLDDAMPLVTVLGIQLEEVRSGECTVRMAFKPDLIRPGGTVAGPAIMALADLAMYVVVLSLVGRVELAVTTSMNVNFLRKPAQNDVLAIGRILKHGKRLAVVEVDIYSEGDPDAMVAHATGTYSIPPA